MGIAAIVKLLPPNSQAYSLRDFLRVHAPLLFLANDTNKDNDNDKDHGGGDDIDTDCLYLGLHPILPKELEELVIAPLANCPVLNASTDRSKNNLRQGYTKSSPLSNGSHGSHGSHRSHCQQSVRAIVDDVVYSLVQRREKLRCQRNYERTKAFRRKRKQRGKTNTSTDHPTHFHNSQQNHRFHGTNALIHGFAVSREGDEPPPCGMKAGITYQHPNENVTFLKSSSAIKHLHELVGDNILRMMLLHTRWFWPIGMARRDTEPVSPTKDSMASPSLAATNHTHSVPRAKRKRKRTQPRHTKGDCCCNYILLCGPPLAYDSNSNPLGTMTGVSHFCATGRRNDQHEEDSSSPRPKTRKKKKRRSFPSSLVEASPLRANESLSRFSLMYCESYVPRVSLPKSHPFPQRLERQQQRQQPKANSNSNSNSSQTKHAQSQQRELDDYNFLLNVIFELHLENKNKQRRIRKRLKGAGKLVCEVLWKNYSSCCNYGRLLEKHCPLPEVYQEISALTPTSNYTNASNANTSTNANNATNATDRLALLAHAYTSKDGIVSFLASVLRRVVPCEFWGSEANFQSFLNAVQSFVHLRRNEKLANKNLMTGISITSMKWLYPDDTSPTRSARSARHGNKQRTNHEAVTELTLQAFRWVFKGFIIPLLRSCFYVTETEFAARELHYYRKPVWALFRALSLQKLTTTGVAAAATATATTNMTNMTNRNPVVKHFSRLSESKAQELLRRQHMGISKLRFLPKATGMRPIAQLSRSARFEFPATTRTRRSNLHHHKDTGAKRPRMEDDSPQEASRPSKKAKVPGDKDSLTDGNAKESEFLSSQLQLLPRRTPLSISRMPTNAILEHVLDVLTYECEKRHKPFGNGLGNLREFYVRYREYMTGFRQEQEHEQSCSVAGHGKSQKLLFAKVDIEKCYDRIHQDYLLNLVQGLVSHNTYVVQAVKMDCANLRTGGTGTGTGTTAGDNALRFKKIVETIEEYQAFHHHEHALVSKRQNTVFELLKCSLVDKTRVLELLREHLQQHVLVTMGRHEPRLLLQSRGISQGSTLSMLLCNLYYGRVEELMMLCSDGTRRSNLMSRFVDDFLLVTPDKDSFQEFLDKTHKGKPELGANINPSKTLVNVNASVKVPVRGGGTNAVALSRSNRILNNGRHAFPWCGLLFDTGTGEVLVDYERFRGRKLLRSITIDSDGSEGEKLAQRLRAFLFPRCLPILYDASINSIDTIVTNFYQMMLFGACKTREYLVGLNALMKRPLDRIHNIDFLLNCIRSLPGYAIKNIRSKSRTSSILEKDSSDIRANPQWAFDIQPAIASALSLQAFSDVFCYSSGFGTLARLLTEESAALAEGIAPTKRETLRIVAARAFDDFRINTMIEKKHFAHRRKYRDGWKTKKGKRKNHRV